ncbi:MAG: hypothetical protein U0U69_10685 [Acidimicrobiia bacterium]
MTCTVLGYLIAPAVARSCSNTGCSAHAGDGLGAQACWARPSSPRRSYGEWRMLRGLEPTTLVPAEVDTSDDALDLRGIC